MGTLSEGFVYNTVCGKKYQAQLEEQKAYMNNVTKESGKVKEGEDGS